MDGTSIVALEEAAMTRLESSAWSLAGGSASVFALAVVLGRLSWHVAFVVVVLTVLGWAWLSPVVTGTAIGGIAWLCVTGFDVHRFGDIRITGRDDVLRIVVLVLAGALAAMAHALVEARRGYRSVDPLWAEFHGTDAQTGLGADLSTGLEPNRTTGDVVELRVPRQQGTVRAERPLPVHPTEEPSDG
jgi:hypothetical protein